MTTSSSGAPRPITIPGPDPGQWLPDAAARHRVLVNNPARLYDFA
jgi:hypothetical protein